MVEGVEMGVVVGGSFVGCIGEFLSHSSYTIESIFITDFF